MLPEFTNEAFVDFNNPEIAAEMEKALSYVGSNLGKDYDLTIGGQKISTDGKILQKLNLPARVVPGGLAASGGLIATCVDGSMVAFGAE